jgi:hypothetical protein
MRAIKKSVMTIFGLTVFKMQASFAFKPQAIVMATRAHPTSLGTGISTALRYRDSVQDEGGIKKGLNSRLHPSSKKEPSPTTGVKVEVIRNTASLQFATLLVVAGVAAVAMAWSGHVPDLNSIHWNDSEHFHSLFDVTDVSGWRLMLGVLAATPMIFLSKRIETLDARDINRVNFSTISKW